jgi:ornithine cyclodeaminase/alanine dehydrogenase
VESGDLIDAERAGAFDWSRAVLLEDIVAGTAPARSDPAQITLFESLGIGLWDIAAANYIYDRAVERGLGRQVDIPG